jgi:uncharacterized protein YdgA (DUF945 family)
MGQQDNRMKRSLISTLVIVVLAALVLPPVFGIITERKLASYLAAGGPDPYVKVYLEDYQRGLYTSATTLKLRLSDEYLSSLEAVLTTAPVATPQEKALDESSRKVLAIMAQGMDLNVAITHGPLVVESGPHWALAQLSGHIERPSSGGDIQLTGEPPYLLTLEARMHVTGATTFEGNMPAIRTNDQSAAFDFSGLDLAGKIDPSRKALALQAHSASATLQSGDTVLSAEDLRLDIDASMKETNFWTGASQFHAQAIALTDAQPDKPPLFKLDNLKLDNMAALSEAGDQVSLNLSYSLDQLSGTQMPTLTNAHCQLRISNLDTQALIRYVELVQDIGVIDQQSLDNASPELLETVSQILAGSPEIDIDPLSFTLDGDDLHATLHLVVDGENLSGTDLASSSNSLPWPDALQAKADVEIAERLALRIAELLARNRMQAVIPPNADISPEQVSQLAQQQSQMLMANFIQQGYLTLADEQISSNIDYRNRTLSINGKQLDLSAPVNDSAPPP